MRVGCEAGVVGFEVCGFQKLINLETGEDLNSWGEMWCVEQIVKSWQIKGNGKVVPEEESLDGDVAFMPVLWKLSLKIQATEVADHHLITPS